MRKQFIFIGVIVIMLIVITGCQNHGEESEEYTERGNVLDASELRRQGIYAYDLWFENHKTWPRGLWRDPSSIANREIIFVDSEEAAQEMGLPYEVIIGWPSLISQGIVEGINDMDINLEDFGLTEPLTVGDLAIHWEDVYHLLNEIDPNDWSMIINRSREVYGREANRNWAIRGWLFPGRLDGLNALLEGRDMSEFDFERLNERYNLELTIEDIPTWPITEEDVYNNSWIVMQISQLMLTSGEQRDLLPGNIIRAQHEAEEELTDE